MDFIDQLRPFASQPISHQLLISLLKEYKRPNDKIRSLIREEIITPVRKGLYAAGGRLNGGLTTEPFLLANHIIGPSYVSCETALAYYNFIPERVYEITSMTTKSSRRFRTPMGMFSYVKIPLPYYAFGITQVKLTSEQVAIMASPEKALCDKIITTSGILFRSRKSVREFLVENMRMDEEKLREINTAEIMTWLRDTVKAQSLSMLIDVINEL